MTDGQGAPPPGADRDARIARAREAADWEAIARDLARLPIVWDEQVAAVLGRDGDNGYRGATPDETDRIVQVVTAHLRVNGSEARDA